MEVWLPDTDPWGYDGIYTRWNRETVGRWDEMRERGGDKAAMCGMEHLVTW